MSITLDIEDDITQPGDSFKVNFKGKHPFSVAEKAVGYLKDVMKISTKDVVESDLRWDITGDPHDFYGMWAGTRKEDRWTKTTIRFVMQGAQSSKDFSGSIKIQIKGTIKTTYTYENFIQKSFWWFFNHMFYYANRRRYFEFARDNMRELREKILKQLDVYREDEGIA
jgi:hypothetical protein